MSMDPIFACGDGLHALHPEDVHDPAGTACRCGAVSLIGVMAAVRGERRTFLAYLLDTNPSEPPAGEAQGDGG